MTKQDILKLALELDADAREKMADALLRTIGVVTPNGPHGGRSRSYPMWRYLAPAVRTLRAIGVIDSNRVEYPAAKPGVSNVRTDRHQ